ncbi:hypothetical protein [Streptomyces sp. A0642]|uniref:hypothetical protein n=1 Tax=Streptomyces sp. A0642 TaxID=2563100 RepID=UPI001447F22A|nr:hypothetical protein [Streptomyces sp. A0642]
MVSTSPRPSAGASRPAGSFPAPPASDPGQALHSLAVADLMRLHNYLAVHRPRALATATEGESAAAVAIRLLQQLPPER